MLVSIAVPSRNYARYLHCCLSSLRIQTHTDFEVLIADGGSTDNSLEIIKEFCEEDCRFRLVSTADCGQADAIDKAFRVARGDILCYLNADDLFLCNDALQTVVEAFVSYQDIHLISAEGYYVNSTGRYLKPVRLRYHPLDNIGWMKYRSAVLQPATFWRKDVYRDIPFDKELHFVFDAKFFYQAHCRYSWLSITKVVAGYRLHEDNKSVTVRPVRILELAKFEQYKFGRFSIRSSYLLLVYGLVEIVTRIPFAGRHLARAIYVIVNSFSFMTAYRFPSI